MMNAKNRVKKGFREPDIDKVRKISIFGNYHVFEWRYHKI